MQKGISQIVHLLVPRALRGRGTTWSCVSDVLDRALSSTGQRRKHSIVST